jgi:hypothetical protein
MGDDMIEEQTIEGGFLNVRLTATDFPLRSAQDSAAFPQKPPTWQAKLITLRFEMQGKAVTEVRAELAVDHAAYSQAEAAGYFGLSTYNKSAAVDAQEFSPSEPIHLLLQADLERIGPHQFEGLDPMHNQNDLEEVLMTITHDAPGSPFHELETWTFTTVQQKAGPDSDPIGFDRPS